MMSAVLPSCNHAANVSQGLFNAEYMYAGEAAPVTGVTFGSPVVGDTAWAANFDAKINARKLAFTGDLVVQVRVVQGVETT